MACIICIGSITLPPETITLQANIYYDYRSYYFALPIDTAILSRRRRAYAHTVVICRFVDGETAFSIPPIHPFTHRLISSRVGGWIRIAASLRFPRVYCPTLSRRVLPALIMYPHIVWADSSSIPVAMRKSRVRIIAYVVQPIATPRLLLPLMSINLHIGSVREPRRTVARGPNGNPRQKRYN